MMFCAGVGFGVDIGFGWDYAFLEGAGRIELDLRDYWVLLL